MTCSLYGVNTFNSKVRLPSVLQSTKRRKFHRYESTYHQAKLDAAVNDVLFLPRVQIGSEVKIFFTSERFEPSSRTFLIGEQPNPWDLLQPQDKMSRHRGAEHRRRYGRLGGTSLLSPG